MTISEASWSRWRMTDQDDRCDRPSATSTCRNRYLVLYQGMPIDVSKLEVVEYGEDRHRLYWKTVRARMAPPLTTMALPRSSELHMARRSPDRAAAIHLPLFWQVFDLSVVARLKARSVTHAYQTFFDRTIANFEPWWRAAIFASAGPVDEPTPPPMDQIMPLLQRIGEIAIPVLQQPQASAIRRSKRSEAHRH